MLKREDTLAFSLLVDVLVRIIDAVDLDHGLVPHIDSGSYREEANTGKEEQHLTWHRCNAHRTFGSVVGAFPGSTPHPGFQMQLFNLSYHHSCMRIA